MTRSFQGQRQQQRRRRPQDCLMVAWLALSAGGAWGHESEQRRQRQQQQQHGERLLPWGLAPPSVTSVPRQGMNFLDESKSLAEFIQRFSRGGGSSSSDFDSRYQQAYRNYQNENNDNYDKNYYGDSSSYYSQTQQQSQPDDDEEDDYYYGGGTRDDADDYYYADRGFSKSGAASKYQDASGGGFSFVNSLPTVFQTGDRRIGLSLVGAGSVVTMLGVSLFFNKALLRLGNLLFISGVAMTMGVGRTMNYFMQPSKMRATACLGLGIFLVFVGSPVFGMMLEVFGLLNLFGNMFPVLLAVAKTMPGIGPMLQNMGNGTNNNSNKQKKSSGNRQSDRYYDDRYYNNDGYYNNDQGYDYEGYGAGGGAFDEDRDEGYY